MRADSLGVRHQCDVSSRARGLLKQAGIIECRPDNRQHEFSLFERLCVVECDRAGQQGRDGVSQRHRQRCEYGSRGDKYCGARRVDGLRADGVGGSDICTVQQCRRGQGIAAIGSDCGAGLRDNHDCQQCGVCIAELRTTDESGSHGIVQCYGAWFKYGSRVNDRGGSDGQDGV